MAPTSKDSEVLIAPPEKAAAVSVAASPRHEDTATGSRPQPVALEVPVSVNGARTVEGSDKREPFSETTKTVLVFGNGAVIRLASPVSAGQLLFLTNEKTKKEVVCQVVKSKNYKSVSGYVELEFTESVVGFWGMRFPSDRIGAPAPASAPVATLPPAAKSIPAAPVYNAPKPVSPAAAAAPKISELRPAQVQLEHKPVPELRPAEVHAGTPAAPKPQPLPVPIAAVNKNDVPVVSAPTIASSLASSLASLLGSPEVPTASTPSRQAAPPLPSESKQQAPAVAGQDSTEELRLQAARLQEQLSSLLFSATPGAKPTAAVPAPDSKIVSGVAARVPEVVKAAPILKTAPPPIKSSLDTEEVKIPSWLEPLARNAAAPAPPQDLIEREKSKHAAEIAAREEHSAEPLAITAVESIPESALPAVGSLLPLDEPVITQERSPEGSHRGVLYAAIAAAVLLAAGGGWYLLHPANAVQGTSAPNTSAPTSQTGSPGSTNAQPATQPVSQPGSPISTATPQATPGSNAAQVSNTASTNAPFIRAPQNSQAVPLTRDNTRGAGSTIPASVTERISRPPAEPQPKKPALGEVHLASPTINRRANAQGEGAEAPTISAASTDANAGGMEAGLASGSGKQPAAPEAPLPVGG